MYYHSLRKGRIATRFVAVTVPCMLAIVLAFGTSSAWASIYHIQKELNLYGYLSQYDESVVPPEIRPWACVPVATANSFFYLQNKYPDVYDSDSLLVPGGDIGAVATILASATYMNTKASIPGTWYDMGIYGKYEYMEEVAPGKTIYGAQLTGTWALPGGREEDEIPPIPKPGWVEDNTFPTWEFLYDNLVACEDVEIGINDYDWGHCLTLTSFHWADINTNNVIDDEDAWIDYIDPATGQWVDKSPIWQTALGGAIYVNYSSAHPEAVLSMAMKESPIPEPATIIVWGLLLAAGFVYWRHRRAA